MTSRWRARPLPALLVALLAVAPAPAAEPVQTPYLDGARDLARWLAATTADGTRWPAQVTPSGALVPGSGTGLAAGAAGIGLFFIALHAQTGEPAHLRIAAAAAAQERRRQLAGGSGNPDYLDGAAGSGLFFLAMHAGTGEARYLDWAGDHAERLEQAAIQPAPGQRYWRISPDWPRIYTGIPHGAAGIATFQLALYLRTGDPALLLAAEEAYAWIRGNHVLPLGPDQAFGFRRLTTDTDVYNWWSGATAGTMLLLQQLHAVTGKAQYREDLRRAADGLVAIADPALPGVNWTYGTDHASGYRPLVFSHGNASIPPALLQAWQVLGEPAHRDTARASLDWILAMARRSEGLPGVYWLHSVGGNFSDIVITSAFVGTASVGWALARQAALDADPRSAAMALESADHLLALAERPQPDQLRWLNYLGPESAWDTRGYELGWYNGNAGVGLFLLAAHQLAIGERPGLEVHAQ